MEMEAVIRKVQQGDASNLAYIQTESWKAAFTSILDAETLTKCTNIERATSMYQRLLDEKKGNGYLLAVDGKPHCIAGSYRRVTSVSETSCFLGTFEISKDFMRQSTKIYHKKNGFRFPEKLIIKLFLV